MQRAALEAKRLPLVAGRWGSKGYAPVVRLDGSAWVIALTPPSTAR